MRTVLDRIELTNRKIQKRVRLLRIFGVRQGTAYNKQREKLAVSYGYLRDGNVTHYIQVGFSEKTRDRNRYGKVLKWSHSDQIKISLLVHKS